MKRGNQFGIGFFGGGGIPFKSDLNFQAEGRSGLTMVDTIAENSVNVLTPTFLSSGSGHSINGIVTRAAEHILDGTDYTVYFKFKMVHQVPSSGFGTPGFDLMRLGNNTSGRGIGCYVYGNAIHFCANDGATHSIDGEYSNANTKFVNAGWCECFLEVDWTSSVLRVTIYDSQGSVIATSLSLSLATIVASSSNNGFAYQPNTTYFSICNFKKFSGLKTITQCRNDSYTTDIQIYIPDLISGTDVSGNGNHFFSIGLTEADKYFSNISTYCMDKGYSVYQWVNHIDIIIPYTITGNPIARSGALAYNGSWDSYVRTIDVPGNLTNHNLADSKLRFPLGSIWDRSNITIFNATCRASSYYDVANPTDWHISELNKITLNSFTNTNYQGLHFPKITGNSYDDRQLLTEIIGYTTNKTGSQLTNVLKYTGDSDIPNILYISSPYSNVIKITANSDTEFKFNLNNAFVYSNNEIYDKIDALPKLNINEDKITSIFRWSQENMDIWQNITDKDDVTANIINCFNSHAASMCGGLATQYYVIMDHYYPGKSYVCSLAPTLHITNYSDDVYTDIGYQFMLYKGYYLLATAEDIKNDAKLYFEPLRKTNALNLTYAYEEFYTGITQYHRSTPYEAKSLIDNMSMKLPTNSTFVFPVKSTNVPKIWDGINDVNYYANGIATFITGIIGNVDMPLTLVQITGTGTVKMDDVTYTLPTDEAALKAVLQRYLKFYHSFEILTNTGGIEAEYLVNPRRMLLWNYNKIDKGIITGDITIESVATAIPISFINIAVNKGTSDSWTINHDQQKKMSGTFRFPKSATSNAYTCTFYQIGIKTPQPIQFDNVTANSTSALIAGIPVIDQCFAPKLMPRDTSFTTSLQLTLSSFDGCSIYYTIDGSTPDITKILYTEPFTITATTTVKAICIKTDYANSNVISRVITKL